MILTYQRFSLTLTASTEIALPRYQGSTFRGGFGTVFRRIVCALRNQECERCILRSSCVYAWVFETAPHEGVSVMGMGKYRTIPHPFVIEPPEDGRTRYRPGDTITFGLVLVGRATRYVPYFLYTFEELGKTGIGAGRGTYRLTDVTLHTSSGGLSVYSGEDRVIRQGETAAVELPGTVADGDGGEDAVTVTFLTPARIMHERRLTSRLPFSVLAANLLRRLSLLAHCHCDQQPDVPVGELLERSRAVETAKESLSWCDWERYSTRQATRMKLGGVTGTVTYRGAIAPFLPFLRAGEILHVGKGTTFGLGKYRISLD